MDLPNSLESEQGVIGALILGADFDSIASILSPEDFYQIQHKVIFTACGILVSKGHPVDLLTLSESLEQSKDLSMCGGMGYLADLAKNTPSVTNAPKYAEIVKDRAKQRMILGVGAQIQSLAVGDLQTEEKIAQAQNLALALSGENKDKDTESVCDVVPSILADIEARANNQQVDGLLTGFTYLDLILKGLKGGHVHVIAGRPASGKTTLAINIAENIAMQKNQVLVFSLEMPKKELVKRMIASLGRIDIDAMDNGQLEGKWDNLSIGVKKLKDMSLSICDKGGMTISRIRTIARFHKKRTDTKLIVIDYIGLIRTPNSKNANRNNELGEVSRQCKELAKELDLPVILLAQLNRSIETRSDKTPTLSDLRDSGEIEQDADTVTFLYRPALDETGVTTVTVAKNRHGKTGQFFLTLQGKYSRFENGGQPQSNVSVADRFSR
jgi:replicative DNA helicase